MEKNLFKKFLSEMTNVKDEHLKILRGHLLIEEKLRELINSKVTKPEAFSDARFSFNQLLCIAEAFYWQKNSDWLWETIRKLNNIRNSFSHQLTPKKYEDNIKGFLGNFKDDEFVKELGKGLGDETRMILAMSVIYRHLDKYIKKPKSR